MRNNIGYNFSLLRDDGTQVSIGSSNEHVDAGGLLEMFGNFMLAAGFHPKTVFEITNPDEEFE